MIFHHYATSSALIEMFGKYCWRAAKIITSLLMYWCDTHFKNNIVRKIVRKIKVSPYFTILYYQWSNGLLERWGKDFLAHSEPIYMISS